MTSGQQLLACAAVAGSLTAAGCAARATGTGADIGPLTVGVSTSGPRTAGLTFRLLVQPGGIDRPIDADAGVFTTRQAPAGKVAVSLSNVPERCRVQESSRREVIVGPDRYPVVRFVVVCT